ncbi:MAG: phage tail sheath subtilisin-like domain-containing protein [Georgfuchsia sp.]
MPKYLAPGVLVEEISYRPKSIEGVPTSTTGFAGVTRFGPVQYPGGPTSTQPRLITSFPEFERVYGGLGPLKLATGARTAYLAHAAHAFFNNGGSYLYVSRVFAPANPADTAFDHHIARLMVVTILGSAAWKARWPGKDGNVQVDTQVVRSRNLAFEYPVAADDTLARHTWGVQVKDVRHGAVVEITAPLPTVAPTGNAALLARNLRVISADSNGRQSFIDSTGAAVAVAAGSQISLVELRITVHGPNGRIDSHDQLAAHSDHPRYIGKLLGLDPEDENAMVWLDWTPAANAFSPAALMVGLQAAARQLAGGSDGSLPSPDALRGKEASTNSMTERATGLEALGDIDDIAIVAIPDGGAMPDSVSVQAVAHHLIAHAEKHRYRFAVVDASANSSLSGIRGFRGRFDSKSAALYYPWIEILDPLSTNVPGEPPRKLMLPPSGFVTGIYARSDMERGVHKAPANEVVRGLTGFEIDINLASQEVLNPEGINCLRFFKGRGYRVWGARTMSSDPEWIYVNVRRFFIFIEHSIDKGTQWAVFEPNNERLWANIRSVVENFLSGLWRNGMLLGAKPEEAYFVRCDRSTMTQNDIDNGHMICLVGVAAIRPAEFVIFRIGQWTADAKP